MINRVLGMGGIIGGLLKIFLSFVRAANDYDLLETLYVIAELGFLLGLVGMFMMYRDRFSIFGSVGFLMALLGLSFIAGPESSLHGLSAMEIGSPVIAAGLLLFSVDQLFVTGHPKLAPALVAAGICLSVVHETMFFSNILQVVAGVLLGLGFSLYGIFLVRQ
ncbi:MAG: hypothetical protein ACU84Q_12695 [Gammaproteobacteria bacterium]